MTDRNKILEKVMRDPFVIKNNITEEVINLTIDETLAQVRAEIEKLVAVNGFVKVEALLKAIEEMK